ncbi:MAG TPA: NAD-glutamate dehydrogenase domain-containing protein [Acidimicrobiales bacterium]|nr:NAD-glutamate dehydrogenase domain-containing protein [Acidimicrobiales bacterium]
MSDTGESDWVTELAAQLPGPDAATTAADFGRRAPASYRDLTSPEEAASDLAELSALFSGESSEEGRPAGAAFGGRHRLVVRPARDDDYTFRIRRFGEGGIELTTFLPVLESFGLVVVESVPHLIGPGADGQPAVHIDDIGVRTEAPHGREALRFVPAVHGPRLVDALEALARSAADVDSLNRLVIMAGFDWRQVMVLRAYLRYWLQCGTDLTWADLSDPLVEFPDIARALIGYFQARFDPHGEGADPQRARADLERARCTAGLDLVLRLDQDRVLRGYLALIDATLRTNYFRRDGFGQPRPDVVIKLDSAAVPELPAPRPKVETFVHGPSVEGIHLRAGLIARGGIRSSDRPDDFRTEVLDLAFAQVKKNAIIVPTGAKGGFVCRASRVARPSPAPGSVPGTLRPAGLRSSSAPEGLGPTQVRAAYESFVSGLLDVTDNIVASQVVPPPGVVAADGPDPYLVVAADKGTATFSDLANSISESVGFWLGDAFASGGSRGYDHKAMGITARGAWVAVRRHFHQLAIDVQSDPIRVAGVGDMSGDVFGNGMLQSRAIRLIAAFDHRHVFLDPDPDGEASFEERSRLARMPGSSWADYRPELLSKGGGVWRRDVKAIPLAPAARRTLGVEKESLSPPELISAVLAAPVDLLWFGGIGTYIKAPGESDVDVADHANDAIRITSDEVRARVIAEGANLAITQRARIRYSRRGGRINADFIDNAAGVATSDREVNLKILLSLAIEEGRLAPADRDEYLNRAEDDVALEVLRQVDHSVSALNRAVSGSAQELQAYEALLDTLEQDGRLDRSVEYLPNRDEMRVRQEAGAGLIRPELAVLLAYAKSDLVGAIDGSPIAADPAFLDSVVAYFPKAIREPFGDLVPRHRLYPELVATDVAGEIVDQLGIVWAHETSAELGRGLDEVAAAFWLARRITGAGELWSELEQLSPALSADAESALHATVSRAVTQLARAYLTRPGAIDMAATLAADEQAAAAIALDGTSMSKTEADALVALAVEGEVATRFAVATAKARVAEVGPVAAATGRTVSEVVEALGLVENAAGLDRLVVDVRTAAAAPPPPSRLTLWQARALLDDISAWRVTATISALRAADTSSSPESAVAEWVEAHRLQLARASKLLASLESGTSEPLTVAALVLRRLR